MRNDAKRDQKGQFLPGHSPNAGGVPGQIGEVRALARAHTARAIERLAYWLEEGDGRVSVTAAQVLLDRGWGRPAQAIELAGPGGGPLTSAPPYDLTQLSSAEFKIFRRLLSKTQKTGDKHDESETEPGPDQSPAALPGGGD